MWIEVIGSSLIVSVVAWVFREPICHLLYKEIEHKYSKELKKYDHDLHALENKYDRIFSTLSMSYLSLQNETAQKKLHSVDTLWKAVIRIKNNTPYLLTMLDVLTKKELSEPKAKNLIDNYSYDFEKVLDEMDTKNIEEYKPYISKKLWIMFYIYRLVNLRLVVICSNILKNNDTLVWQDDEVIKNVLDKALTDEEIKEFQNQNIGHLSYIRNVLETKMLLEIESITNGTAALNETTEKTKEISRFLEVEMEKMRAEPLKNLE